MKLTRNGETLESIRCIVRDVQTVPTGRGVDLEDVGKNWLENEVCRWANGHDGTVTFDGNVAYVEASNVKGEVHFE